MSGAPRPSRQTVTGAVLAGGRGTRMDGRDKGLVPLAGRPMVEYVLEALRPQTAVLLINANRSLDDYRRFGVPVVSDRLADYPGPLAGVATALAAATTPWVVTAPCDGPLVPENLVSRLAAAADAEATEVAVAHDGERLQPVYALLHRDLAGDLETFLAGGGRRVNQWLSGHTMAVVDFSDQPWAFLNVNRPQDAEAVLQHLGRHGGNK